MRLFLPCGAHYPYLFLEHVDEGVIFVPSKRLIGFVEDALQDASALFHDRDLVRGAQRLRHLHGQI